MQKLCERCGILFNTERGHDCKALFVLSINPGLVHPFRRACELQGKDPQDILNKAVCGYIRSVGVIKRRTLWPTFLDQELCKEDPVTGKRPCEDGILCEICKTPEVRERYETWLFRAYTNSEV